MSKLDELVNEYNLLFESVTNVGDSVVCYERDVWDSIRQKFSEIIARISERDIGNRTE